MIGSVDSTGEQALVRLELRLGNPGADGITGLFGDFKLNGTLGLLLHDHGTHHHSIALHDVANT